MANYSYLDLATEVLKDADNPLTYQEIWESAKSKGLVGKLGTTGKTPWQTLGAQLYVQIRDNQDSKIVGVGRRPIRFFLKSRENELTADAVEKIEVEETKGKTAERKYKERDLHPLFTYFAYANPSFNRGR